MRKTSLLVAVGMAIGALLITAGCDDGPALEKRNCVVMLGDSIFDLTEQETEFLEDLSGVSYRHYYLSGAEMEGGYVTPIPKQYEKAVKEGAIRTVILDGGGNDVSLSGLLQCSVAYGSPLPKACLDIIDRVSAATEAMLLQMAADGVQNIIWQGYYHTTNSLLWQVSDYTNGLMKKGLAEFQAAFPHMKVIFIDVQPYFNKYQARYYTLYDGIHPNAQASEKLANLVWDAMVDHNIEQGVSCN